MKTLPRAPSWLACASESAAGRQQKYGRRQRRTSLGIGKQLDGAGHHTARCGPGWSARSRRKTSLPGSRPVAGYREQPTVRSQARPYRRSVHKT